MIRISYNDFMPNSGNVSLDSVQDKLQELFLADNIVVLEETNEQFDSSQRDRLEENIMKYWTEHTNDFATDDFQKMSKKQQLLFKIGMFIIVPICVAFFQFNRVFNSTTGTYVYHDVINTEYTLTLFNDKTVWITERWAGDSELAKELSGKKGKGSWSKRKFDGGTYIYIDISNGSSLYLRGDYIYTDFSAMKARDYNYGFPITKKK